MTSYLICFAMAGIATYFTTRFAIFLSKRYGVYDMPKKRNMHATPIPILGGVALLLSIGVNAMMVVTMEWNTLAVGLLGAVGIVGIGVVDDRWSLSPFVKLLLQMMVVTGLFRYGIHIDFLTFPANISPIFFHPWSSFFVTQLWMITIMNIFNLIDGIDGLAVGVSCITALVLFVVSLSVSPVFIPYLLMVMAGATGAFLRFNFYPAKIFLGDSGSLLLGYLFAFISVVGVLKSTISFIILGFVFAIPLMDLVLSVIRRIVKRKNIFYPDLEHVHHQLVRRGLAVPVATGILWSISLLFGIVAIFLSGSLSELKIWSGVGIFVAVLGYFAYLQMSSKRFRLVKKQTK